MSEGNSSPRARTGAGPARWLALSGLLLGGVLLGGLCLGLAGCSGSDDGPTEPAPLAVIHVSAANGVNSNDGSASAPVATITKAIALAEVGDASEIRIAADSYDENVVLLGGVDIFGGCVEDGWTRPTGSYTNITLVDDAMVGDGIGAATTIEGLAVIARSGSASAPSSIALYLNQCTQQLRFVDCRFTSATGADGGDGDTGQDGSTGNAGSDGGNAACSGADAGAGGVAGIGFHSGGHGGDGGVRQAGGGAGDDGQAGEAETGDVPAAGGLGGGGGADGDHGAEGADGSAGGHGTAADHLGFFYSSYFFPANGEDGDSGQAGQGGVRV